MDIDQVRSQYPHIANGIVHLNHAGISPLSLPAANAMREYIDLMTDDAAAGGAFGWQRWNSCRDRLTALLGAAPDDVAVTKNTAHGLSIAADGLKWNDGDEIVFADCEYPSNTYPWFAQRDRSVVCRVVPTRPDGSLHIDDFRAQMSSRTRLVAVSWVQFSTGWRCDLAQLSQLAHEFGALFAVDVIQGLGALPIDVTSLGIDIAATGSQKWLMGPMGAGGLYIRQDILDQFRLVNMGALSVNDAMAFDPLGFDPRTTTRRYEEGTPNFAGCAGLDAAIELLTDTGIANVEEGILRITRYAMEGLKSRGYIVLSPENDRNRAGIVIFRHPTLPGKQIADALTAAKVNVVERGGGVRFAPHFYNTETDIDQALEALP